MEAIDPSTAPNNNMVYSDWLPYTNRLYSANWNNLFTNLDFRSTLTWNSRLTNFNGAQVYNFYSSGEEVLREWDVDPPTNILSAATQIFADYWVSHTPVASYVWVWQEKGKGRAASDTLLGSTHGGWKFNSYYDVGTNHMAPSQAALLTSSQLQTNAFFDFASASFTGDLALYGGLGNAYAYQNHNRILSDAIPALSFPVGANHVSRLAPLGQPDRNFNMNVEFKINGWPSDRKSPYDWLHSDFHQVAYTFTYKLFDEIVNDGNLK